MAKYQLLLPKMGESVAEATIIKWLKKPGDYVEVDETIMEIATDKVDSEVPSPVAGILSEQLYAADDVVQVGAVIATIETSIGSNAQEVTPIAEPIKEPELETSVAPIVHEEIKPTEQVPVAEPITDTIPGIEQLPQTSTLTPIASAPVSDAIRFYSPLVRSIASQEGIGSAELDRIPGTGTEGRLTKDDLLLYIQNRSNGTIASQPVSIQKPLKTEQPEAAPVVNQNEPVAVVTNEPVTPAPQPAQSFSSPKPQPVAEQKTATESKPQSAPQPKVEPKATSVSGEVEIIEMDRMRKLIAEHMVYSKHTSPHVTSFVEADVTALVKWRDRVKDKFEAREGEKITFTPIFIEAVVKAIKDFPMINVSVSGTQIIKKKDINISMATALPNGNLIVPVIKNADELNLVGLTKAVNDLANRARTSKLLPDDVKEGTFTITNVGSFGNVMGTPIINQPQVAILAVGAIKKKPAVIETKLGDMIGIRHMMFLSLSYDHRVVDGALGGMFVKKIADYLENWDINREV
jgi:2-oxoglutarate dehydrogenase E2 component (dihydrolipoamide succinyltransferase)